MYNFLKEAQSIRNSFLCRYDSLNGYASDFHINGNVDGWDVYSSIYLYGCWNGMLFGTSYADSCYIGRTDNLVPLSAENYHYVKIMLKITDKHPNKTAPTLTTGRIRWITIADNVWDGRKQVDFDIVADDQWRLYTINMGPAQYWQGYISNLRIYPFIDGKSHDGFAIKFIKISSDNVYTCSNTDCSYHVNYTHPCPGAGSRGTCEAAIPLKVYTTLSGVSDTLILDINGYGPVEFLIGEHINVTGIDMARILSEKIGALNIGGYAYAECIHTEFDKLKIFSGVVGSNSSVVVSGSATDALGFSYGGGDISTYTVGTDPASGFDYASSRLLTAKEINALVNGHTEDLAYLHNPSQYTVEAGRSDFNVIGTSALVSDVETAYYSYFNNASRTIIDLSHPINSNGRLKRINVYGKVSGLCKIKIFRPHSDGTLSTIYSIDMPQENNQMYTTIPLAYKVDCDILVNRGDLIGIYNADVAVGISALRVPDASFFQVDGDKNGRFDPGIPQAYGVGGLAIYARSDRYQSNVILDIDLGDRVNIEQVSIHGKEDSSSVEFNVALCLDVTWEVNLFGDTHFHSGFNWWSGQPWSETHLNKYYGKECLDDGIRTADNGQLGTDHGRDSTGIWTSGGNHSYFYVNGDAEWLYSDVNDGKHEFYWPYVPGGQTYHVGAYATYGVGVGAYTNDPISFTLTFPYQKEFDVHKTVIYFKEDNNFRQLALSYYLGQYNTSGDADDPHFKLIPNYNLMKLDGIPYYPDDLDRPETHYLFKNPTNTSVIWGPGETDPVNWQEIEGRARSHWYILEHQFNPVRCKGFRFYTNEHYSTKIMEMEVYSKFDTEPSLLDNITITYSDYGELWHSAAFYNDGDNKISAYLGGAPRYVSVELDSASSFELNEIEFFVGDQVKLENCEDTILLDHARRGAPSTSTPVVLENVYGRDLDLLVNIPVEVTETNNVVFWSKLHSESDITKPDLGPPCRLYKAPDMDLGNASYQCAINVPAYGLKNLVDDKQAYYSYNGIDYFDFGTLSSGMSVDFCNTDYVGYRKTVITFPGSSSRYWKVYFPSAAGVGFVNDLLVYYDDDRQSVESIFVNSAAGIYAQSGEVATDGVLMLENDFVDDFGGTTYIPTWTLYNYNSTGTVAVQESGGGLRITNYGTKVIDPYGARIEHVLDVPASAFDVTLKPMLYTGSTGRMGYWTFSLFSSTGSTILYANLYDAWDASVGYMQFGDSTGNKYSGHGDYISGLNTLRIVFAGNTAKFYVNGNLRYNGGVVGGTVYKVGVTFGRWGSYAPYEELGMYDLRMSYKPAISNAAGFGFLLDGSEAVNSITLIHDATTINSAEIYASPDNGNNYVKVADTSQVIINPKNQAINTNFAIDLEKRHDLAIIRNYGSAANKYFLSLGMADYSNTVTTNVDNVAWANSNSNDVRWLRLLLPNESPVKCIGKLGIYPDISTVFCQGGGYNCDWEPLGTILSDYTAPINVAYGATTTGTNNYAFDFYPDNAVDGIHTDYTYQNCWGFEKVDGVDPYIELDFGAPYMIDKVLLYHGFSIDNTSFMNNAYTISVSPTASGSFTTVLSITGNTNFTRTHQFTPVLAQRLRLTVTSFTTSRFALFDSARNEYVTFAGSFLREIEVYSFVDNGYVDSETWPVICMNLQDQFEITGHELINKDITDTATDWNNAEEFFKYSDNRFDSPQKVAFNSLGGTIIIYQSSASSGDIDRRSGAMEYVFISDVYFLKNRYAVEWSAENPTTENLISLSLEGPAIIDSFASNLGSGWITQTGFIDVPEDGFYTIKGKIHEEYGGTGSSIWGIRYPKIYRQVGLRKWAAVTRDTATDYAYDNDAAKKGIDYLSSFRVYGNEEYKSFAYSWWCDSVYSSLSNDAMNVISGNRSLKIDYPASSGIDTVSLIEGDSLSQDLYFDPKNFLKFWWYIDDISNLDTEFGTLKFGAINEADPIYFQWDIESMDLQSGWNNVRLKFEDADYFYPPMAYAISTVSIDPKLDFRNNDRFFKSFVLTYRGLGDPISMNLDGLAIERNDFDDDVKFGKGLFLNGFDYLEIPLTTLSLEYGAIEFWIKSFVDSYGSDVFGKTNSRVLFTLVNNNNNIVSLGIESGGWFVPILGHIRDEFNTYRATDSEIRSSTRMNRDQIYHIGFVWSNDGSFTDNGDTMRLYVNGVLNASSKEPWDLYDTKAALLKLGGPNTQLAYNFDIWGGGIFENVKIYNYCKTDFNLGYEGIDKDIVYTPNDFLEISTDNVNFYGLGSINLPFVFEQVPAGESRTVYIRSNKTEKFLQSKLTATLVVEWLSSV